MGTIYFVKMQTGPVKIGFTDRPMKTRLCEIQSDSPYELELIGLYKGDLVDEDAIHGMLKKDKIRGEWFHPSARMENIMLRLEKTRGIVDMRG